MGKNNKPIQNPVIIFMSIVALLLGIDGVHRLLNIQGMYDIFMGISLAITGLIGGFLGIRYVKKVR